LISFTWLNPRLYDESVPVSPFCSIFFAAPFKELRLIQVAWEFTVDTVYQGDNIGDVSEVQ